MGPAFRKTKKVKRIEEKEKNRYSENASKLSFKSYFLPDFSKCLLQ
jgi:hypothetical protein